MSKKLNDSHEKGKILEEAVEKIENFILATDPSLKGAKFSIEKNKTMMIYGVKQEIDIFIKVDGKHGYESIFICECKNRKKSASKNDIIDFSQKIEDCNAQTGFFIAKKIGKYARAQAERNPRIKLFLANDNIKNVKSFPFSGVWLCDYNEVGIKFDFNKDKKKRNKGKFTKINPETILIKYNKKEIKLKMFVDYFCNNMSSKKIKPSMVSCVEKIYKFNLKKLFQFKKGELLVNNMSVYEMEMTCVYNARFIPNKIENAVVVENRGAVVSYDEINLGNKKSIRFNATFIK